MRDYRSALGLIASRLLPGGGRSGTRIVVFDFSDRGKRNLYNFAIGTLDLHTRCRQGLGGFHAAHNPTDPTPVDGDNFDVVLTVERLEGRESFGYFHSGIYPSELIPETHGELSKRFEILRLSGADVHSLD